MRPRFVNSKREQPDHWATGFEAPKLSCFVHQHGRIVPCIDVAELSSLRIENSEEEGCIAAARRGFIDETIHFLHHLGEIARIIKDQAAERSPQASHDE